MAELREMEKQTHNERNSKFHFQLRFSAAQQILFSDSVPLSEDNSAFS